VNSIQSWKNFILNQQSVRTSQSEVESSLFKFRESWNRIVWDQWCDDFITNRLILQFVEELVPNSIETIYLSQTDRQIIQIEINQLIQKQTVKEVSEKGIAAPIFTIPKKGGKLRPV
jgi:hypothetical protein